jgi:hypothetical protein
MREILQLLKIADTLDKKGYPKQSDMIIQIATDKMKGKCSCGCGPGECECDSSCDCGCNSDHLD